MKHASNGMRTRIASWLAAAVLPWAALSTQAQQTSAAPNAATAKVPIGGKFALADASGKLVTDKTYIGKWQLIFFGFTSCPDVCWPQRWPSSDRMQPESSPSSSPWTRSAIRPSASAST